MELGIGLGRQDAFAVGFVQGLYQVVAERGRYGNFGMAVQRFFKIAYGLCLDRFVVGKYGLEVSQNAVLFLLNYRFVFVDGKVEWSREQPIFPGFPFLECVSEFPFSREKIDD